MNKKVFWNFVVILWLGVIFHPELLAQKSFDVGDDAAIQKSYKSVAESPTKIKSNYRDGFTKSTNAVIHFKFSINGADNERKPDDNHLIFIRPENKNYITPVFEFGNELKGEKEIAKIENEFLPKNSEISVVFKVDFRTVLKSFKEKGYFDTFNGSRITKENFEGLFIAGDSEPLSWNFGEIQKDPQYKMTDPDGDGIYECKIVFKTNDYRSIDEEGNAVWQLKNDISQFPKFESQNVLQQALYNMALEELLLDIRPDSTFMAGAKWHGVWTRDISYSIFLSLALIKPDIAKQSLLRKVSNGRIIQDTGTGGSWPISTDRVVWAVAAWEVYLITGDSEWLKLAYEIIKKSVGADIENVYDKNTNLVFGESSFLDWREQTYPLWMDPKDIYKSSCLGTNALHYRTLEILSLMENELGNTKSEYTKVAANLKTAINKSLWLNDKGYFGQFTYGRNYNYVSPKSEALGEALSVLFNIADEKKSKSIFEKMPVVEYGPTCIFPQIKNIPPYHNNAIWPFVISYWTWAASKAKNETAVQFGMDAIYRAASLFLTNKENLVADNGHFDGTEINSDRMLWSIAGNLSTIYRVMFGIDLNEKGLKISPFVPEKFGGDKKLTNFKYRNASLDITVHGFGSTNLDALIDGKKVEYVSIPKNLSGKHTVEIFLDNKNAGGKINIVENHFAPATPAVTLDGDKLNWSKINGAEFYKVFQNGLKSADVKEESFSV
ncbi:MAG: amylo-alpha-1,6-glucosidase, partial [Ignavibacteriaceae bacterium]